MATTSLVLPNLVGIPLPHTTPWGQHIVTMTTTSLVLPNLVGIHLPHTTPWGQHIVTMTCTSLVLPNLVGIPLPHATPWGRVTQIRFKKFFASKQNLAKQKQFRFSFAKLQKSFVSLRKFRFALLKKRFVTVVSL